MRDAAMDIPSQKAPKYLLDIVKTRWGPTEKRKHKKRISKFQKSTLTTKNKEK